MEKCGFIFRRDFRVQDNVTLFHASKNYEILPIFIFNKSQLNSSYASKRCINFMIESLEHLSKEIDVLFLYEDDIVCMEYLIKLYKLKCVAFNSDKSHYAIQRDKKIKKMCEKHNVECLAYDDYNLFDMNEIQTQSGKFYEVYTPFYNKCLEHLKINVPKVQNNKTIKYVALNESHKYQVKDLRRFYTKFDSESIVNGSDFDLKIIKTFQDYDKTRNYPHMNTTLLSAYLKFGLVSIRQVYLKMLNTLGHEHSLIRQLIWKEFYSQLMFHLPKYNTIGGGNYKNLKISWESNNKNYTLWKNGETGFPFIDAGMRQLNSCGWMHNRARMATANFLVMVLHLDWRKGEKYFASRLLDYDVAQNNGNWQWNAGVGIDKSGYLRIYNPWKQSVDFDKDCTYIKHWVPELAHIPNEHIHKWDSFCTSYDINYPNPCVDYKMQRLNTLKMYN